ncbi:MAG: LysR family transcriptional regulator [Oscillospiraceae bacterium]|nr:LysR family transcriptional regulator [Oscillospiraceae bacterium]
MIKNDNIKERVLGRIVRQMWEIVNFQQLKYYSVLCETGSFSSAAEKLFISPQGLNVAISNLEAELSCKFFIRSSKGLTITPDGEYFRDWARGMLENIQECWDHFEGRDAKNAEIKCAGVQGVLCEFAADLINRFENTYQGFSVYLREYKDCICDDVVENEEVELGFGMEPLDEKKFECHRLLRFKLVCLMHESHPWAKYDKIPLAVLPTENFIMVDEQFKTADSFIKKCAEKGVEIHPKLRVGEITAVHRLVREHNGVGLTNQSVADALATPDTVWREFDSDDMYWAIDIFKKKSVKLSKSAQIFWEYVQRKMSMDEREKIAPAVIMEQHFT